MGQRTRVSSRARLAATKSACVRAQAPSSAGTAVDAGTCTSEQRVSRALRLLPWVSTKPRPSFSLKGSVATRCAHRAARLSRLLAGLLSRRVLAFPSRFPSLWRTRPA